MIDLPAFDALALSLHHDPGVHAVLVGSGLSKAAGIPTGWEITLDLVRRLVGVTEQGRLGAMVSRQIRQRAELLGTPARPRLNDLRAAHDPSRLHRPA
jgi:hypothetical protein